MVLVLIPSEVTWAIDVEANKPEIIAFFFVFLYFVFLACMLFHNYMNFSSSPIILYDSLLIPHPYMHTSTHVRRIVENI